MINVLPLYLRCDEIIHNLTHRSFNCLGLMFIGTPGIVLVMLVAQLEPLTIVIY